MEEHLMRAMAVVQDFVRGSGELETTLRAIAEAGTRGLDASMAGLTIRNERGALTTVAYTDEMVPEIDQTQYDTGRGPCVDASRSGTVFEVHDTRRDDRWPEFAAVAARHGIHSSLSMPVIAANDTIGALNFYDREVGYFDAAKRRIAEPFAGQCAVAGLYWSVAHEATGLAKAMESRAAIEQAKGVIMGATGCSASEAFDLLRQQSQAQNQKLRDVAEDIIRRQHR